MRFRPPPERGDTQRPGTGSRGQRIPPSRIWAPSLLLVLVVLVAAVSQGLAQGVPPDSSTVRVGVQTDRPSYRVNEPVHVVITVVNPTDRPQNLQFDSGCMVNYGIDRGGFNWLSNAACPAVITQLHLPPRMEHVFPAFIHTPRDYFLTPGEHVVWAEVLGYGRASTTIMVTQGNDEPPAPLLLVPDVSPTTVTLGETVSFGLTVVNLSREVQTFATDGCPLQLRVDGWWTPDVACTENVVLYALQPGERLRLAPDYARFDTSVLNGRADAVGPHLADLRAGSAGASAIRFLVVSVGGGPVGAVSGTVSYEDGQAAAGALVFGMVYSAPNDTIPPPPHDSTGGPGGGWLPPLPPRQVFGPAAVDAAGRYRLEALPAGDYLLWAQAPDGSILWYGGVRYPELATPVTVSGGQVTEGIDFVLPPYVPPPPPFPGVIEGTVLNWIPEGSKQPQYPIPGTVVVALMESAIAIEDSIPSGDDGDDDPTRGPNGDSHPTPPDGWWVPRFYGMTNAEGHFEISVPYGTYLVVAGERSHRYQWWPDADRLESATEVSVLPDADQASLAFALKDLDPTVTATISGHVLASTALPPPGGGDGDSTGTPRGGGPAGGGFADGEPRPIEGAQVMAHLLIEDPLLMTPTQIVVTTSGSDGGYTLNLRPNSPVLVQAFANGHIGQFYDHVSDIWNATPVDVTPDKATEGIDFDLQQQALPPEWGNLSGRVTTPDASVVDRNGDIGERPIGGAIVRVRSAGAGFGPFETVTRTDGEGWWFVSGLPYLDDGSIQYLVSAEAEGFIPTYHPAAHRAAQATPVRPMPPYVDALVMVDISLLPQPVNGPNFIAGHIRGHFGSITAPPGGGGGSTGGGQGGDPVTGRGPFGGAPGDSLPPNPDGTVPLVGAFVYVVRVDPTADLPVMAGAVACDNGTFLLTGLPDGSYLVYADRPGFSAEWYGGDSPTSAAVIQLGPGLPSALLDFTLEPLDADGPPRDDGGDPGGDGEAGFTAPMTDLRNAPNPSKPQTTIMYRLRTMAEVTVRVFDLNGRLVRTLFDRSLQNQGEQRVAWDGRDENGEVVGAGMYFYRVETARQSATGKMVVVH